jgi:hypothetical protein
MTTNGVTPMVDLESVPATMLTQARAQVMAEQRFAAVKEREMLTVRYRVQKCIGADKVVTDDLLKAIEQCELALMEMEKIEDEWRAHDAH